jgi:hypothetical protein
MLTIEIQARRFSVVSSKPFEEIVKRLTAMKKTKNIFASTIVKAAAMQISPALYSRQGTVLQQEDYR